VPSGASTGSREAAELRDGDTSRYGGRGVLKAAGYVNGEIADRLRGRSWNSLAETDRAMTSLDGTPGKSRLGANAIVGVSMALARALAVSAGTPLWSWLTPDGVHAPNDLDFQEFMIASLWPWPSAGGLDTASSSRIAQGNPGLVHRQPRRRHRLRAPQVRRARPRRADRQVQPAAGRSVLRYGMSWGLEPIRRT
jgi:hypothetical protein